MPDHPRNTGASVRQRLLNLARARSQPMDLLLTRYALERLLYRLSLSPLGNQGLDINIPEQKYRLQSLPGQFSGLHLLSIMYAAFRQIDPAMELGMDFEAEYLAAFEQKKG